MAVKLKLSRLPGIVTESESRQGASFSISVSWIFDYICYYRTMHDDGSALHIFDGPAIRVTRSSSNNEYENNNGLKPSPMKYPSPMRLDRYQCFDDLVHVSPIMRYGGDRRTSPRWWRVIATGNQRAEHTLTDTRSKGSTAP
eukprot:6214568-Pleurochrysis_carterae.AAC.3